MLKYYIKENFRHYKLLKNKDIFEVTDPKRVIKYTRKIVKKLSKHFKVPVRFIKFSNNYMMHNAWDGIYFVTWGINLLDIAHEFGHCMYKELYGVTPTFHNNKHAALVNKVAEYIIAHKWHQKRKL